MELDSHRPQWEIIASCLRWQREAALQGRSLEISPLLDVCIENILSYFLRGIF